MDSRDCSLGPCPTYLNSKGSNGTGNGGPLHQANCRNPQRLSSGVKEGGGIRFSLSLFLCDRFFAINTMGGGGRIRTTGTLVSDSCHCLAAARRFQAAAWLRSTLGESLKLSPQPSEEEFLSCLRNGLVLCNAINKIKPGAVPKVVESHSASILSECEKSPLPAYQYFENVRNFTKAVEEMKLPAFEASVLERVQHFFFSTYIFIQLGMLEPVGSTGKIVDCILALKSYHEWIKSGSSGSWKYTGTGRSPMVSHSSGRNRTDVSSSEFTLACRRLDLSSSSDKHKSQDEKSPPSGQGTCYLSLEQMDNRKCSVCADSDNVNLILKQAAESLFAAKENIDQKCLDSRLLANTLEAFLKEHLNYGENLTTGSNSSTPSALPSEEKYKALRSLMREAQTEFNAWQSQLRMDLIQLAHILTSMAPSVGNEVQGLSTAALGYQRVIKENRNLYNMLQDLKGNIRVYCRIRPLLEAGYSTVDFIGEDGCLTILNPLKQQKDQPKTFQFNKVFGPTSTQVPSVHIAPVLDYIKYDSLQIDDVYMDTQPLIRSVMDGYNVCIFAYGQTGSGKTYTMVYSFSHICLAVSSYSVLISWSTECGTSTSSWKDLGINYKALDDLFKISQERKDYVKYEVQVQMVEIYNEQVRDLLAEDPSTTKYPFSLHLQSITSLFLSCHFGFFTVCDSLIPSKLEIRSSTCNGLNVPDASLHLVQCPTDIHNLMRLGQKNRAVSSTAMNNRSSRSHSVLTVHVQGIDTSGSLIRSSLHLVDLAGSERVDKSEATGDRLKEAQYINRSLSCLGDVIAALAQKNSYIPYRNSKLTQLLQDSLGGQAKTLMFAHVSPEADSYGETISTLKFAERVSAVELGAARLNKESGEVRELKEQVEYLKKAIAKKEGEVTILSQKSPPEQKNKFESAPPHRPRRMSIEGSNFPKPEPSYLNSVSSLKSPTLSMKSETENTPVRSRRLSIEKAAYGKMELQQQKISRTRKAPGYLSSSMCSISTEQSPGSSQVVFKAGQRNILAPVQLTVDQPGNNARAMTGLFCPYNSYSNMDCNNQMSYGMAIPLPLPRTPDFTMSVKKDGSDNEKQSEASLSSKFQLLSATSNRKGSQIRKSLNNTIGKLINGSDKRNLIGQLETSSPFCARQSDTYPVKSPVAPCSSSSSRRRQSLTGHVGGLESSRRSSLGGKMNSSCTREPQSLVTPATAYQSVKTTKRWL
ncbi:Kinesin-4 [Nymphaea thermarum]|nr:Kinesin-4 [Nymphaea thermarum]